MNPNLRISERRAARAAFARALRIQRQISDKLHASWRAATDAAYIAELAARRTTQGSCAEPRCENHVSGPWLRFCWEHGFAERAARGGCPVEGCKRAAWYASLSGRCFVHAGGCFGPLNPLDEVHGTKTGTP